MSILMSMPRGVVLRCLLAEDGHALELTCWHYHFIAVAPASHRLASRGGERRGLGHWSSYLAAVAAAPMIGFYRPCCTTCLEFSPGPPNFCRDRYSSSGDSRRLHLKFRSLMPTEVSTVWVFLFLGPRPSVGLRKLPNLHLLWCSKLVEPPLVL